MAKQHKKMDPALISTKQVYELDWVIKKMKAEGITVSRDEVRAAARLYKNSRKKVYSELRHNGRA